MYYCTTNVQLSCRMLVVEMQPLSLRGNKCTHLEMTKGCLRFGTNDNKGRIHFRCPNEK